MKAINQEFGEEYLVSEVLKQEKFSDKHFLPHLLFLPTFTFLTFPCFTRFILPSVFIYHEYLNFITIVKKYVKICVVRFAGNKLFT